MGISDPAQCRGNLFATGNTCRVGDRAEYDEIVVHNVTAVDPVSVCYKLIFFAACVDQHHVNIAELAKLQIRESEIDNVLEKMNQVLDLVQVYSVFPPYLLLIKDLCLCRIEPYQYIYQKTIVKHPVKSIYFLHFV